MGVFRGGGGCFQLFTSVFCFDLDPLSCCMVTYWIVEGKVGMLGPLLLGKENKFEPPPQLWFLFC